MTANWVPIVPVFMKEEKEQARSVGNDNDYLRNVQTPIGRWDVVQKDIW